MEASFSQTFEGEYQILSYFTNMGYVEGDEWNRAIVS